MNSQKQVISLIKSISGQANVLTIPRLYITLAKSHRAALMLSQCVYWSDKTKDPDGWFYKTYGEWKEELGMNQGAIDTAMKSIGKYVSVKVKKVGATPKRHYKVNFDLLVSDISDLLETDISDLPENNKPSIAKTTTGESARKERAPADDLFPIAEAISKVCRMDLKANRGKLFKEAQALMKATPTPTPDLIEQHYNGSAAAFWKSQDWRGKRGELPTPDTIRATWGQWTANRSETKEL